MWGYYANGFKGIAIEVDVPDNSPMISPVVYVEEPKSVSNGESVEAVWPRVLTTKLECWHHENEYRYLVEGRSGLQAVGRVTAVYFGNPYGTTVNAADVHAQPHVREYQRLAGSVRRTAEKRGIVCHEVEILGGQVRIKTSAVPPSKP